MTVIKSHADYIKYPTKLEKITVQFDDDHYIRMKPINEVIEVEGNEIYKNYVEVTFIDRSLLHEVTTDASIENIAELLRMLQDLTKQLQKNKKGGN